MAALGRRVAEQRTATDDSCRDAARRGDDSGSRFSGARRDDTVRTEHGRYDAGIHDQGAGDLGQVGVHHARHDDDSAQGHHHCAQGDRDPAKGDDHHAQGDQGYHDYAESNQTTHPTCYRFLIFRICR